MKSVKWLSTNAFKKNEIEQEMPVCSCQVGDYGSLELATELFYGIAEPVPPIPLHLAFVS